MLDCGASFVITAAVGGRPGRRRAVKSPFRETSLRCQATTVAGVTAKTSVQLRRGSSRDKAASHTRSAVVSWTRRSGGASLYPAVGGLDLSRRSHRLSHQSRDRMGMDDNYRTHSSPRRFGWPRGTTTSRLARYSEVELVARLAAVFSAKAFIIFFNDDPRLDHRGVLTTIAG
jgi:hypothetical protein